MVRPPPQPLVILGTGLFSEELADLVPQIPGLQVAGFVHCDEIPLPMPDHLRRLVGSVRRLVRRWTGRNMDYWRQVFLPLRWLDRVIHNSPKGEGEASLETEGPRHTLNGLPIFSSRELFDLSGNHLAISGMNLPGYRHRSTALADATGIGYATLVHPTAKLSPTCKLGEGSFVGAGAIIASRTCIGRHVIINRGAVIGHHVQIDDFVSVGPGAKIAGNCIIEGKAYIGIGAVLINNITIQTHSVVGGGAVVTRNVPNNVQVVGVPAKVVKKNITEAWERESFYG